MHEYGGIDHDRAVASDAAPADPACGPRGGEDLVGAADLKHAIAPVREVAIGAFLWGSQVEGRAHERSDIDICVVAGPGVDRQALYSRLLRHVIRPGYDVKIFEDLPLYLQGAVLEADALIWARNEVELFEYLRPFRRRWADESHRLAANDEALRQALARG